MAPFFAWDPFLLMPTLPPMRKWNLVSPLAFITAGILISRVLSSTPVELIASEASPLAGFGRSLSADGNTIVVGAQTGAYLFQLSSGDEWEQVVKLSNNPCSDVVLSGSNIVTDNTVLGEVEAYDLDTFNSLAVFGRQSSIALSGNTLVLGNANIPFYATVYERQGGVWSETTTLWERSPCTHSFGASVAVTSSNVFVGCPEDNLVFVYSQSGASTWEFDSVSSGADISGWDMPMAATESVLVSGMPSEGMVHVFEADSDPAWSLVATLSPSNAPTDHAFGSSVAVFDDVIIVGAENADRGKVYVFQRQDNGDWNEVAMISPEETPLGFGSAVAVDRDFFVVGADDGAGAAYVYPFECGDGIVSAHLGEECDPGSDGSCNEDCTPCGGVCGFLAGLSAERLFASVGLLVGVGFLYMGFVGAGEGDASSVDRTPIDGHAVSRAKDPVDAVDPPPAYSDVH